MDMSKVLDEAKEKLGVASDYGLAKKLGIPNPRISEYRSGKATPDAYSCARLADALGVDPLALLAQVEAATEKNEARRNYWRALCERVGVTVLSVFIVTVTVYPDGASASMTNGQKASESRKFQNMLVKVKRALRRLLRIPNQIGHRYA